MEKSFLKIIAVSLQTLILALFLMSCSTMPMGNRGIKDGMSRAAVLRVVSKRDNIISQTQDKIITEGQYDPVPSMRATKTFYFRNGRLIKTGYTLH